MSKALDRINRSYQDRVTYAGINTVCNKAGTRYDPTFHHASLMGPDADELLQQLRDLGWTHVDVQIRATHIPTHTEAILAIDDLLA